MGVSRFVLKVGTNIRETGLISLKSVTDTRSAGLYVHGKIFAFHNHGSSMNNKILDSVATTHLDCGSHGGKRRPTS